MIFPNLNSRNSRNYMRSGDKTRAVYSEDKANLMRRSSISSKHFASGCAGKLKGYNIIILLIYYVLIKAQSNGSRKICCKNGFIFNHCRCFDGRSSWTQHNSIDLQINYFYCNHVIFLLIISNFQATMATEW